MVLPQDPSTDSERRTGTADLDQYGRWLISRRPDLLSKDTNSRAAQLHNVIREWAHAMI